MEVLLNLFQTERNEVALLRRRSVDEPLHSQVKMPHLIDIDDVSSIQSSATSGQKHPICRTYDRPRKGHPGSHYTQWPRYISVQDRNCMPS